MENKAENESDQHSNQDNSISEHEIEQDCRFYRDEVPQENDIVAVSFIIKNYVV